MNTYTITYKKTRNPYITHYANESGRVGTRFIKGLEETKRVVEEMKRDHVEIISVRNNIGKKVQF